VKKIFSLMLLSLMTIGAANASANDQHGFRLLENNKLISADMPKITLPVIVGINEALGRVGVAMQLDRDPDQAFAAVFVNDVEMEKVGIVFEKAYEAKMGAGAKRVDVNSLGEGVFHFVFFIDRSFPRNQVFIFGFSRNDPYIEKTFQIGVKEDDPGISFWSGRELICTTNPKAKKKCFLEKEGL